jgi:hypothetical protein
MVKMYAKSRVRVRRGDIAAASFSVGERDGWRCASALRVFCLGPNIRALHASQPRSSSRHLYAC